MHAPDSCRPRPSGVWTDLRCVCSPHVKVSLLQRLHRAVAGQDRPLVKGRFGASQLTDPARLHKRVFDIDM